MTTDVGSFTNYPLSEGRIYAHACTSYFHFDAAHALDQIWPIVAFVVSIRLTVTTGRRAQRTSATWLQRRRGPLSMPEFHASSFRYRIVPRDVSALSNKPLAS
ncbi:MAG: hypothetical protein M3Y06_01170 [Actinomycetota bacterium]|nr:hypothetical protein [Actinomycetota bacterium]